MTRLDAFLSHTGLIRHRSEAKRACVTGCVRVDGRVSKPGREVHPGAHILVELPDRLLEVEVRALPSRPVARRARAEFCKILREERRDPYSDLEF